MSKRVPPAALRRFQSTFQAFLDEHRLTQDQVVHYLRRLNVNKSSVSRWFPPRSADKPKSSQPASPTITQLGELLGRLLQPDGLAHPAHLVTPEQARQLFNAYLELHQCPETARYALTELDDELARQAKEIQWHQRLHLIQQDLADALLKPERAAADIELVITATALTELCNFFYKLHGTGPHGEQRTFRAVVFTRREGSPHELGIMWAYGFLNLDEAKRRDYFYCGDAATMPDDPVLNERGGVAGLVFVEGQGDIYNDLPSHDRFVNPYPRRKLPPDWPYDAALLTVIRDLAHQEKLGLLCVDSKGYAFTQQDLELVNILAKMLGRLLVDTGIPILAK